MKIDRRTLAGLGIAALASAKAAARPAAADLDDPQFNLDAYIRMRGDLSGAVVIERVDARTFGVVEKQLPRALHAAIGIQVSRFRKLAEGYSFRFKYFSMATDIVTGAPLSSLANPYTGATNAIPPRLSDNPEILLTIEGWRFPNRPKDSGTQKNPGIVRPWQRVEKKLLLTDTLISPPRYERHPAFQAFTYAADFREATSARRSAVDSTFAGTGMEDWRDWMEIKALEGSLCVHTFGAKVRSRDAFPAWLVDAAMKQDKSMFEID
jgi:hypothetical protein